MRVFNRRTCNVQRTPEQRRQDDSMVLFTTLFTVIVSLFVVLFS